MYPGGTDVRQMYLFSWLKEVNHRKVKFPTPWIWYMHVWKCSHMKLYFVVSFSDLVFGIFENRHYHIEGKREYDSGRIAIKYAISHNLNRNLFTEVINQVRSQFLIDFCKIGLFFASILQKVTHYVTCLFPGESNLLHYLLYYFCITLQHWPGVQCHITTN